MRRLSTEDIVDLEVFINADGHESEEYKDHRDFKIYSQAGDAVKLNELALLKHWVESVRKLKGGRSLGGYASLIFKLAALLLFLLGFFIIGMPLANMFFNAAQDADAINVSYFFASCVLVPLLLFITAIFFAKSAGELVDIFISFVLGKIFKNSGGLQALYSANKKWLMLKGAATAQYLGVGIVCGIFCVQLFRPMFNEYQYGWRTTMPDYIKSERISAFVKCVATPWRIVLGEEMGYPSLEQIKASYLGSEYADENTNFSAALEKTGKPADSKIAMEDISSKKSFPHYETWSVFFIMASLFYGVFLRCAVLAFYQYKILKTFGIHRIRNDRKISEILHRMKYASSDNSFLPGSVSNSSSCDTLVLLRQDLNAWQDSITENVKRNLSVQNADIFNYEFSSELLEKDFQDLAKKRKNIAFVYLSDDYNEEVFESIENLVNNFSDKFISIHLLGRLSKQSGAFNSPPVIEKSWWERKVNSVSTRNLKLF